jgi:RNA polymerase sigma-70 factor, ECF subfamily
VDETPSDARLLRAARQCDERAFLDLYREHRTALFRFAWRLTGSAETAEDVAQECFLALLKGAGFDARQGGLRTYLFGMARNLALRGLRLAGRECEERDEAADAPGPLDDLLAAERSALVERAVRALPVLQREALILFEYEEMSLEEIAAVTGADVGAVKGRLHRARERVRRRLGPLLANAPERSCT